tara:strand:- start:1171 stop:1650 length:480 start_codon:yes stop_codon:yes gene_type:complete
MNKKIFFLRHAKSSWDLDVSDINRPLNQRGVDDITKIGKKFNKFFKSVEFIITSPAVRAISTCVIFSSSINFTYDKIQINNKLYTFNVDEIIKFVYNLNDSINEVILVGHNPAFTYAANFFSNEEIIHMPTSSIVSISFNEHKWSRVKKGKSFQITRKS